LGKQADQDPTKTGRIRNFSGLISRIIVIIRQFTEIRDLIGLKPAFLELFGRLISLPVDL
jgi:hypothetical protein